MQSTALAGCRLGGPRWCSADHRGETTSSYAHTTADSLPTIETRDPRTGVIDITCIDIEQTETDPRPVIVLHGTAVALLVLSLADAKRLHAELGERIALAERR